MPLPKSIAASRVTGGEFSAIARHCLNLLVAHVPDFQSHIERASGYLELGMLDDAANQLEGIAFAVRRADPPEVELVAWDGNARGKKKGRSKAPL